MEQTIVRLLLNASLKCGEISELAYHVPRMTVADGWTPNGAAKGFRLATWDQGPGQRETP